MSKKVLQVKKNFLSKNECNELIIFYNENISYSHRYRDTFPLNLNTTKFKNIIQRIEKICFDLDSSCQLDTHQIVKWVEGSEMKPHLDLKNDIFACVVYLNDDYSGGETCFKKNFLFNRQIKPEIGKLVLFSGTQILHSVNKVKKGTRYTLAFWFVKNT